jgi:pimeloyl-ACP methyl ester carboxylesterase
MDRLSGIFDRTGVVARPSYGQLAHELTMLFGASGQPSAERDRPIGQGQPVLVIPAFLTNDAFTRPLRHFLKTRGFRVFGGRFGINWGPTPHILASLRHRVGELHDLTGRPIDLVGVSLGGILARDVAYDCPDSIRQVVTIASPFRLPTASTLEPLVRLCSPFYNDAFQAARLSQPLPVPATAFFTREDGIVAWESCRSDDPGCTNIEVTGGHVPICRNAEMQRLLVARLAGGPG